MASSVEQTPTASLSLPSNSAHQLELCREITSLVFSLCALLHHSPWQRASSLPPQNARPAPSRAHPRKHLAPLQATHVSQMHCYSVRCCTQPCAVLHSSGMANPRLHSLFPFGAAHGPSCAGLPLFLTVASFVDRTATSLSYEATTSLAHGAATWHADHP